MPLNAIKNLQKEINRLPVRQNDELDMTKSKRSKTNTPTDSTVIPSTPTPVVSQTETNNTNTITMATANQNRTSLSVTATLPPQNLKFAGNVSRDDPDYDNLTVYDVEQFLVDLDTRIQTLGIQTDEAKIQEAQLLVNREKGDARWILVDHVFKKIKNYQEFKDKCREIYEPKEATDKFYNLNRLRTVKPRLNGHVYSMELAAAVANVVRDIDRNLSISKMKDPEGNTMVNLEQTINYIAYGTLHDYSKKEYQDAMRKIDLNPKEDLHRTYTRITEELRKSNQGDIEFVGIVQNRVVQGRNSPSNSQSIRGNQNQGANNAVQRGQGQYRGNTQGKRGYSNQVQRKAYNNSNYNQGNSYDQGNSYGSTGRRNFKGGSYRNQGNRGRAPCKRCNRNNHETSECIQCGYCNKFGHYETQCRSKHYEQSQGNSNTH